ncbi:MAG TPA: hypothetical protein VNI56_05120 [Xanthomonadaceae bacterium]|nr:hypothetical protein [Xanthomonadaceae bacterium]
MRIISGAVLLATGLSAGVQAADAGAAGPLSSHTDYTLTAARNFPVRCKDGDIEYFAGRTMGEVFGNAWPEAPVARTATRARVLQAAAPSWPPGLGPGHAVVVVATLVGADGRPIQARALCATMQAIAKPAVRASLRSRYEPARFDGVATTSVVVHVLRFEFRDAQSVPDRRRR